MFSTTRKMLKIAHRGYSEKYGDNNMISFHRAIEHGFDMIELDIQLCKTGEIVIYHDVYIDKKRIDEYTLPELIQRGVSTLDFFFTQINPLSIRVFLDVKGHSDMTDKLVPMFQRFTRKQLKNIYVSGFDRRLVERITSLDLPIKIGFTTENTFTLEQLSYLASERIHFFCFHWSCLNKESIDYLHSLNKQVFTYTCDTPYVLTQMQKYNVDGIVSNRKL
jgi:glycerophosphoryl diester phosphodiesterase